MVTMRDGVRPATDVYRPDEGDPHPVLVHRIPYDKSIAQHVGSQMVNPLVAAGAPGQIDRGLDRLGSTRALEHDVSAEAAGPLVHQL